MKLPITPVPLFALVTIVTALPKTTSSVLPANQDTFSVTTQTEQPLQVFRTCPGDCHAPTGCCVYLGGLWYCGVCDKKDEIPDKAGKIVDDIGTEGGEEEGRYSL